MAIDTHIRVRPARLVSILKALIPAYKPVLIKGQPGIGKTDIVKQVTKELGFNLLISHPVVDDPVDYKGIPFSSAAGKADFIPVGHLAEAIKAKKPTVFFLDDLGQAPPVVQAAAMQLILGRQINGHKLPDVVTFVAATNRKEDRAGVSGILEPVKSRFSTILELQPQLEDWTRWALQNDMPEELVAFINWKPDHLTGFKPTADITNTPCPRTIAYAGEHMKLKLTPEERMACIAGAVGDGMAVELNGFLDVYGKLPDPELALKNPDRVDLRQVIGDPAVTFAFLTGIAIRANTSNMKRVVELVSKFSIEYQAMAMKMVITRDDRLVSTEAYLGWFTKNKEIMIS